MSITITISGLHGTGKSTYARKIAEEFKLRYISAGELFRQIAAKKELSLVELSCEAEQNAEFDRLLDERSRKEIRKGCVVIDGLLAGWVSRGCAALKVYLSTPYRIRIGRIACRDGMSYVDAEKATVIRERIERRRFKRLYGIDICDLSIYDLVLNTGLMPIEQNIDVIKSFVSGYIKSHEGK